MARKAVLRVLLIWLVQDGRQDPPLAATQAAPPQYMDAVMHCGPK